MGYYSRFELSIYDASPEDLESIHADMLASDDFCWGLDLEDGPVGHYESRVPLRRVISREDLRELSAPYPHVLFVMERVGEESPDAERIFARAGRAYGQQAEVVYPEFDPEKLR